MNNKNKEKELNLYKFSTLTIGGKKVGNLYK
jgi:hypothetical protein